MRRYIDANSDVVRCIEGGIREGRSLTMAHYQMPGCQLYRIHKTLAPDESKAPTNASCTNNNLHQKENVGRSTWAPRAHMLDPDTKSLSPQFTPTWLNDSSIKRYSVKGLSEVLGIDVPF